MIEKRIEFPTVFRFFATSFFGDLHRLKTFENFVHLWLAHIMKASLTSFGSAGPFSGWNRTVRDVRGIAVRCFRRIRRRLERSERYNLGGIIRCIFLTSHLRNWHIHSLSFTGADPPSGAFPMVFEPRERRVRCECVTYGATTHEAGRPRSPPNVPIDSVIRVMQINCASTSPRWRDIPGAGSAAALAFIRRCRARYRRSSQSFQVQYLSKM